jgi:hypothetical protein
MPSVAHLKSAPSAAQALIPPDILRLLGPPPLTPGEDTEKYERIFAGVAAALEPGDLVDWIRCRDVADLTWKIQRLMRLERALFATYAREALVDVLMALCGPEQPIEPRLIDGWCTADPAARREIQEILRDHGTDIDAILGQAVINHLPAFDAFERACAMARAQRDRTAADLRKARVRPLDLAVETSVGPCRAPGEA